MALDMDSRKRPVSAMRPGIFVFDFLAAQTQAWRMARARRRGRLETSARDWSA